MDLHKRLLTQLYATLTGDSTLQTAMGGSVNLYLAFANPDAAFPYLVHRIDFQVPEWSPERRGTYYIDIWTDSPNADTILAIRAQLLSLLDELEYPDGVVSEHDGAWFWAESDMFVPEPEQGIWHYNITFAMKVLVESEVERVKR